MTVRIDNAADERVKQFLRRVDQARGARHDGQVDENEAAAAMRRITRLRDWRQAAGDAFGLAPRTPGELLRFALRPPRLEALARILSHNVIAGRAEMAAAGEGQAIDLGSSQGKRVTLTPAGRIAIAGQLPNDAESLSQAMMEAARLVALAPMPALPTEMQRRLFATLSDALTASLAGRRNLHRERLYAASMTLLFRLAEQASPERLRSSVIDRLLQGLAGQKNLELRVFYLGALEPLLESLDAAQRVAFARVETKTVPTAPPVEAYTANRSRPLEVRHTIHEDFWKREIKFYNERDGWQLVKQNADDSEREYTGTIKDPSGKEPAIAVHVVVRKDELDTLRDMSDPAVHVIIYSGHSSVGGNGSQSIDAAGHMRGLPKTVLMANCRGMDNYAEFANKFPNAMLITTSGPTYSEGGQARIKSLYDTLAAGETFAHMRRLSSVRVDDEPASNYFYPDELKRFLYRDADQDGRIDRSVLGGDCLFDIDTRRRASAFTRAVNFINSVMFYHWEVEAEHYRHSTYGRAFSDHFIPDGPLADPHPGEVVRVTPEQRPGKSGALETFYRIQYNPELLELSRDVYAGVVTANVVMQVARLKFGALTPFESMRALLLGAQAVYYLDVYEDTTPRSFADYFTFMGVPDGPAMSEAWRDVERLMKHYDAHANQAQTQAFINMLKRKHGVVADTFAPRCGDHPIYVA